MIFRVLKVHKLAKEAKDNPGQFAGEEIGGMLKGLFIMPFIAALLLLALLFVFGFTTWLGGPFGFFKFLFFFSLIGVGTFFFTLRKAYMAMKRATRNTVNKTIKVESKVVDE